jgi:hypothetical protein
MTRTVKTLYPDKPVILEARTHPLLPHQTLAVPFVDIVVKGQGEDAMLEIVLRVETGDLLRALPASATKERRSDRIQRYPTSPPHPRDTAEGLSNGRL